MFSRLPFSSKNKIYIKIMKMISNNIIVESDAAGPVAKACDLSKLQLRELLNAVMHTLARVVQEVGHLLERFCVTSATT